MSSFPPRPESPEIPQEELRRIIESLGAWPAVSYIWRLEKEIGRHGSTARQTPAAGVPRQRSSKTTQTEAVTNNAAAQTDDRPAVRTQRQAVSRPPPRPTPTPAQRPAAVTPAPQRRPPPQRIAPVTPTPVVTPTAPTPPTTTAAPHRTSESGRLGFRLRVRSGLVDRVVGQPSTGRTATCPRRPDDQG
ncbi:unnamed protein product [Trichogramma brassicae]|uniref:Uncharacterized protein n=1 Tax=Trichogramma brassicae TaxID=86971 RepID=A0A6H5IKF6_9HYME|nr:unnamed protein product [Trichogramma brassicae]